MRWGVGYACGCVQAVLGKEVLIVVAKDNRARLGTADHRGYCAVRRDADLFTHYPSTCALAGVVREVYGNQR